MGFVIKIAIVLIILLMVAHYVSPQLPTNPVSNWLADAEKAAGKIINKDKSSDVSKVKVSKWTDAKGVVHYDDRPVGGAKTIEVDTNVNVMPSTPAAKLPDANDEKPKTMNDELRDIQEAKKAHFDALTQ